MVWIAKIGDATLAAGRRWSALISLAMPATASAATSATQTIARPMEPASSASASSLVRSAVPV